MTGVDKDVLKWIEISDYDLRTAEAMLKGGRYLYVLFCCQQALEKRLKGAVVKISGAFPPRTHDLWRLASSVHLKVGDDREVFLRQMTNYYIGSRYPEEVSELARGVDKSLARACLEKTKEFISWLDSSLR